MIYIGKHVCKISGLIHAWLTHETWGNDGPLNRRDASAITKKYEEGVLQTLGLKGLQPPL